MPVWAPISLCTYQECWQSCKDKDACVSWWWCDQREGCLDEDGRSLPFKGCELRSKTLVRRLGQPPAGWRLPTFAVGYMKRAPLPRVSFITARIS